MTVRKALGAALHDLYRQSWRLLLVNGAVGAAALAIAAAAAHERAALAAAVLLGPLAAALAHCTVTLARTGDLRLADALAGLALYWRRGLALGALAAAVTSAAVHATVFYGGSDPLLWPLAFLTLYVSFILVIYQLLLWTLAVGDAAVPLREAGAGALGLLLRRPIASVGLGLTLALVNAAGIVAALMPFLTLTVAYSFLAAAHFVFSPTTQEEVS
jgi:hypothetical protein